MGMFDHVRVEHESMDEAWRSHTFQTKDTDPDRDAGYSGNLDTITISSDGRFLRQAVHEGAPPGAEFEPFTGPVVFYDFETPGDRNSPFMFFRAVFRDGVLVQPIEGPSPQDPG